MPRDDPPIATPPAAVPDQNKPLRSRHEAFCQHFVLLGNAADAASKAGYAYEWARNQGYRLMRQPRIQARIAGHTPTQGGHDTSVTTNDDISAANSVINRPKSKA